MLSILVAVQQKCGAASDYRVGEVEVAIHTEMDSPSVRSCKFVGIENPWVQGFFLNRGSGVALWHAYVISCKEAETPFANSALNTLLLGSFSLSLAAPQI